MISKVLIPLLILVILPSIAIAAEIYFIQTSLNFPSYLRYFQFSIVIIVIIYGSLSYSRTTKKYYSKKWMENLLVEHEFIKKLLYISIPTLIIVTIFFLRTYQPEQLNFSYALLPGIIFVVGGTLLRFFSNISKRNFRFYYAKACIQLSLMKTDRAEKMNLLVRALNSYNKYLKRILKLEMQSIDEICSKIISDSSLDKDEFTKSIYEAFQSDDKLKPTLIILNLLKITNPEKFLARQSSWDRIKEWGVLLAAIVPVVIAIIQFILTVYPQPVR